MSRLASLRQSSRFLRHSLLQCGSGTPFMFKSEDASCDKTSRGRNSGSSHFSRQGPCFRRCLSWLWVQYSLWSFSSTHHDKTPSARAQPAGGSLAKNSDRGYLSHDSVGSPPFVLRREVGVEATTRRLQWQGLPNGAGWVTRASSRRPLPSRGLQRAGPPRTADASAADAHPVS